MVDTAITQYDKKMCRKFFIGANWKCNGTTDFVREYIKNMVNDLQYDANKVGKCLNKLTRLF